MRSYPFIMAILFYLSKKASHTYTAHLLSPGHGPMRTCALLQNEGKDQEKDPTIQQMVGIMSWWEMSTQGNFGRWCGGQAEQAGLSHTALEKPIECLDKGACFILNGGVNQGKGMERDCTCCLEAPHNGKEALPPEKE